MKPVFFVMIVVTLAVLLKPGISTENGNMDTYRQRPLLCLNTSRLAMHAASNFTLELGSYGTSVMPAPDAMTLWLTFMELYSVGVRPLRQPHRIAYMQRK